MINDDARANLQEAVELVLEANGQMVTLTEVVERKAADAWPADYFDRIVGGWAGEWLERSEQGVIEERETLTS